MQIETKFFGSQEVKEEEFINFKHGLPGFESCYRFVFLKYKDESPFLIMQSIEQTNLAFIMIGLEQVVPGYSIELTDDVVAEIELQQPEDAMVYAIVTIPGDLAKATVNLAAPLCVNSKEKLGKQIILNNPEYELRHPLFAPVKEKVKEKTVVK